MRYYRNAQGDYYLVDSLSILSFKLSMQNEELKERAYSLYFDLRERSDLTDTSWSYIENLHTQKQISEWHKSYFKSKAYYTDHNFKEALKQAQHSIEIAQINNDKKNETKSYLMAGMCADRDEQKILALKFYMKAQSLLKSFEDYELELEVFSAFQRLYFLNDNYDRANYYSQKQFEIYNKQENVDTASWLIAQYQWIEIELDTNFNEKVENKILHLLNYSRRNGYNQSFENFWSIFRSAYIREMKIKRLYELYVHEFPEDFKKLKTQRPETYKRVQAYFHEYNGQIDSAKLCWNKILSPIQIDSDLYTKAHLTRRYAEFLFRIKDYQQAQAYAEKALHYSQQSKYTDFIIQSLDLLVNINENEGNFKKAYQFIKEKDSLEFINLNESKRSKLAVLSLQNEYDQEELLRKSKDEKEKINTRNNYILLIGGIFIFLIVSTVIFRQYKLTRIEKKRSDDLLLNILPEKTAEELKQNGIAKARQFENVTVLFSDFVGFTKVAEQLSPEDLVQEIDTYFRGFDELVSKYGLEKIKTVGDAYVAVGGLPQENNATALDVTHTAIGFLELVQKFETERSLNDQPSFKIRLGLHTGNVVAGVVGSKKFQYDIWGDAVNIAARMEQNSLPGRINISAETYSQIKNHVDCEFRGKINAKNKGPIEMYFVAQT